MAEIHVALGASIKNAIHAAQSGDVVVLAAGTHILDGHVVIPGGVTVTAEAGTTVDASGLTYGDAFYVYEDGVTISNFTLIGNGNAGANNGIRAQASATNDQLNGLVIENMTVENFRRAEIDLNGAEGALLSNVTVDGRGSDGAGIALTDVTDVELHNISVANAKWGGVAVYSGNVFADRSNGSHDIRFTGTFDAPISADQPEPILLQAKNGYPIADYTLPASYDYAVVDSARSEFRFFFDRSQDAVTYAQRAPATSVIYQNAAADGEAFSEGNIVVYPGMDLGAAYAAAKPGQVVHVIGTSDQDTHIGRGSAPDWFTGGADDDTFFGGAGAGDRFVYDTATAADITSIQKIGQNIFITTNEGTDTLNGVEEIQFADGQVYTLSGTNIVAKAEADTNAATEDGPVVNGSILDNIQDLDGNFAISGIAAGTTPATGNLGNPVEGAYGTLVLQANGSYTYTANLADSLADGQTAEDVFTYTINDGGVLVHQTITVAVTGTNDVPVITSTDVTGGVFEAGDLDSASDETPSQDFSVDYALSQAILDDLATLTTASAVDIPTLLADIVAELPQGSIQDAFAIVFNTLDDFYDDGVNYSHVAHNTSALRLGMAYAEYLQGGGRPLDDVIVKAAANRSQSLHDNLLGNFGLASLADRFPGDTYNPTDPSLSTGIYAEIRDAGFSFLHARPYFGGYTGDDAGPTRAFDQANDLAPITSGQLTANDVDGDSLTWSVVDGDGQYGTLIVDADGKWRYVIDQAKAQSLAEGASEDDVFTVQVSDGKGGTATTTVTITVNGTNDAPTMATSIGDQTTAEDAAFSFEIPAGAFADADNGATLTYTATLADGSPLPAWLSFDGTTFSGTPTNDNVGNISLKVTATDEFGASTSQTFNLTITNENDAPTFDFKQDFSGGSSGITSGSPYGNVTIVDSFTNSADEVVTGDGDFAIITKAGSGPYTFFDGRREAFVDGMTAEVKVYLDTGWATGEGFDYSVAASKQSGGHLRDFIFHVVKAADGNLYVGGSNNANGGALNQNPNGKTLISESGWYTIQHVFGQTGGPNSALQVTMNLIDADGNIVASIVRTNPADLIATVAGGNYYGWFARLEVADGVAVDDYALTGVDSGSAVEGADSSVSLTGQILFNDVDGDGFDDDSLTVAPADGQPAIGTFTATVSEDALGNSGGTITWNFDADESEIDYLGEGQTLELKFDVTIDDGKGGTATKTITVTITGTNDGPVAQDATVLAVEDGTVQTGSVIATDADGNAVLSYSLTGPTPDGLTFNPDGTYSFDPSHSAYQNLAAGEEREIVVTYEVTDDQGATDNGTLTITVTGTNDLPVITSTDVTGGVFEAGDADTFVNAGWDSVAGEGIRPESGYQPSPAVAAALAAMLGTMTDPGTSVADVLDLIEADLPSTATRADAILAVWDYLDTFYSSGAAPTTYYYHIGHNTATIRLGIEYAAWLKAGNAPLTDAIVKYSENAGGNPTRQQSVHDNLLGNFNESGLDDRFTKSGTHPGLPDNVEDTAIYAEIDAADLLALLDRPWISGNIPGNATDLANAAAVDQLLGLIPASSGQLTANDVDGDSLIWSVVDGDGQYGTLIVDADGKWRYVIDQAKAQSLAEGASEDDVFTVQVSDGKGGTATTTVTITVNGTNDAPVAQNDAFAVSEDDAVLDGSVTATDADDGAVLAYSLLDAAPAGLDFNADGTFSFDPSHSAYQSLAEGEELEIVVTYQVTDENGAKDTGTLTITVTGTNDAPVAKHFVAPLSLTEDTVTTGLNFGAIPSELVGDVDTPMAHFTADAFEVGTVTINGGAPISAADAGITVDSSGNITIDTNVDAYQHLAAGQSATVIVSFTVEDDHGASDTGSVAFTVTGTNDVPVATPVDVSASLTEGDSTLDANGSFTVSDVDATDSLSVLPATVAISGTTAGAPSSAALLAMLTITPTIAGNAGTVAWEFNSGSQYFDYLAVGETLTLTYTVEVSDGTASTTQDITITITGTNDAPVVLGSSVLTGEVTEVASTLPWPQATGTIDAEDDGGSVTFSGNASNEYGIFAIDPTTGAWTFTLDLSSPTVQALNDGDQPKISFLVTITDAQGAETTTEVEITINGSDNLLTGTPFDDILYGTPYNDTIIGGDGDDIIYAGSGDDVVNGGNGDDIINGGSGNDIIDGGNGDDTIDGGSGDDTIYGGNGDDTINGGSGNDTIDGGKGSDTINGGSGDDFIYGGDGSDILNGGAGNDTLWGGAGRDTLTGGDGADIFLFVNAEDSVRGGARDLITDFEQGIDKIDLSQYDANTLVDGLDKFFFRGEGSANRKEDAGFLKFYHDKGNTFIVGGTDNGADGLAELLIELQGIHKLTADDFIGINDFDPDTGTAADDVFYAGVAQNTFHGGGGADRFVFTDFTQSRYGNNWDIIADWSPDYVIDLSGINAPTPDGEYSNIYFGTADRNVLDGQIKIYEEGGSTFVVGDQTGDLKADFKIEILGTGLGLTDANFLL